MLPGAFPNRGSGGNPVRTDVLALPLPQVRSAGRDGSDSRVGGRRFSGGASPEPDDAAGCRQTGRYGATIWHQSGKGAQLTVEQQVAYAGAGQPQHKVTEFIDYGRRLCVGGCGGIVVPAL